MVIDPNCDLKLTARRLMWGKVANAGQVRMVSEIPPATGSHDSIQTCIAPDYALVPKGFVDQFVRACKDV